MGEACQGNPQDIYEREPFHLTRKDRAVSPTQCDVYATRMLVTVYSSDSLRERYRRIPVKGRTDNPVRVVMVLTGRPLLCKSNPRNFSYE